MVKKSLLVGEKNKYEIQIGEFIIGRPNKKNLADIGINDFLNHFISKQHCKIYNDGEKIEVEDLNSTNGTYVNDKIIKPYERVVLKNGDILQLAGCKLEVKILEDVKVLNNN